MFNTVLMNVFSYFISNKNVTFCDKDPSCITEFVESKIKWKNKTYKMHVKNECTGNNYLEFQKATNLVPKVIKTRKQLTCHKTKQYKP